MKVIEGRLPEGKRWRTLVLFSPQGRPGLAWQLALQLAEANSGEMVAAILVAEASTEIEAFTGIHATLQSIQEVDSRDINVYPVLIEAADPHKALLELIEQSDIDLLVADEDSPYWEKMDQLPVHLAVARGAAYHDRPDHPPVHNENNKQPAPIRHLLVPTAGGPNTAVALSYLVPLLPEVTITLLYIAPAYLGESEEAHGRARLRQLSKFVDAGNQIEMQVLRADSVTAGIVEEATNSPYDLVILGATRQSSLDRALFGDVVGAVVRESKIPVVVVREASTTISDLSRDLAWRMQRIIPRLTPEKRTEVYVRIRRSARPNRDFFVLIGLSALIAALGLLLSSPAVVIGAMLVAPLMSPMVGAGLAIMMGNTRFLRLTLGAIVRGVLLAIFLSMLTVILRPEQPLTPELLLRTQPTLTDLGIALFAGLAGAYALAHSEAAAALPGVAISAALVPPLSTVGIAFATGNPREGLGALLLFSTNLIAIIAAAVFTFFVLGFRPTRAQKQERFVQQRSVQVALVLLIGITVLLGLSTYQLARESRVNTAVRDATKTYVNELTGVEFVEMDPPNIQSSEPLVLDVTVRATRNIPYSQVLELRDNIGSALQEHLGPDREIALTLTVIPVTRIDPQVPPTPTPEDAATPVPESVNDP